MFLFKMGRTCETIHGWVASLNKSRDECKTFFLYYLRDCDNMIRNGGVI